MHTRHLALVLKLKSYFGVGSVITNKDGTSAYAVGSLKDLNDVIIPYFTKFPLVTQNKPILSYLSKL
jgi:hypothetical protein